MTLWHPEPANRRRMLRTPLTRAAAHKMVRPDDFMAKGFIMAQWKVLGAGSLLALLLGSTAQADVTAAQVWQSWQTLSESMGQTIKGTATQDGDTLNVTDITITSEFPDGSMVGSLAAVAFRDLGDGTVEVTMAPDYPVTITTQVKGEDPVEVGLVIRQTGLKLIVSGDDARMAHDFTADTVAVVLDHITGAPDGGTGSFTVSLNGAAGQYLTSSGDQETLSTELSAASLTFDGSAADPSSGGDFKISGSIEALQSTSSAIFPKGTGMADMPAALKAGLSTTAALSYGKITYSLDFKDATSSGSAKGSADNGGLAFGMDANALNYGILTNGTDITVSATDLPFPEVNASIAELAFKMVMPLAQSGTAEDFSFLTRISGLSVSDEIWGMFDPGAVLPRDPATLIIDVAGKAQWLVDIFAQDPATTTETPARIEALTINQIQLAFAGADVTGSGDFTFDNNDMMTYPGMPKPIGKIDARMVGVNGLIDKVIQLGYVPEEQAMGARMMLGMFAKAVEGAEDTLTSTMEFTEDGSIFANGMQIK